MRRCSDAGWGSRMEFGPSQFAPQSAAGRLRRFAGVRCRQTAAARRGRRYPAGAHAVAVYASLRLRCGAHTQLAPHNSLRELRSLRSNKRGESDMDARCARRAECSAPRRHRNRPHRAPPATLNRFLSSIPTQRAHSQRRVRAGRSAPLGRRAGEQGHRRSGGPFVPCERPGLLARRGLQGLGSRPRAQRELSSDSSHLFERSERSDRSELCDGAARPSSAGKSERSADRTSEALRPARTRLCHTGHGRHGGRSWNAVALPRQAEVSPDFMRVRSGETPWST